MPETPRAPNYGNAGVMLLNLAGLRRTYAAFLDWIFSPENVDRGLHFGDYGPGDQGEQGEQSATEASRDATCPICPICPMPRSPGRPRCGSEGLAIRRTPGHPVTRSLGYGRV